MLTKILSNNLFLLFVLSGIWGSAFIAIKFAVQSTDPISVASLRLIIAAIFLYIYFKIRKYNFIFSNKQIFLILLIGLIGNFIPFFLISWSEQYIQSNTAGLLLSVAPIFTLILSHFFTKDDRFTLRKLISIFIGLIGVAFIFDFNTFLNISDENQNIIPKIAIIFAALGYVISAILAYNLKNIDIVTLTTFVTMGAALISLPFLIYFQINNFSINLDSFIPIFYLGLFPTAIAFLLRFYLISKAGPIFLSYVAYLIPIFAIIWGYIFLKESINTSTGFGVILILIGVFISQNSNAQSN